MTSPIRLTATDLVEAMKALPPPDPFAFSHGYVRRVHLHTPEDYLRNAMRAMNDTDWSKAIPVLEFEFDCCSRPNPEWSLITPVEIIPTPRVRAPAVAKRPSVKDYSGSTFLTLKECRDVVARLHPGESVIFARRAIGTADTRGSIFRDFFNSQDPVDQIMESIVSSVYTIEVIEDHERITFHRLLKRLPETERTWMSTDRRGHPNWLQQGNRWHYVETPQEAVVP